MKWREKVCNYKQTFWIFSISFKNNNIQCFKTDRDKTKGKKKNDQNASNWMYDHLTANAWDPLHFNTFDSSLSIPSTS